tara:strand:+ start:53567 stop:55909 length:2343 start_codon:yes stop_codon:yes gene_type:complete
MKNYLKKIVLTIIVLSFSASLHSQNAEVNEWVDYSPYHSVFSVAEGNDVVYGATNYGLVELTKKDNSFLRFSKVAGLSDVGITCLGFNQISESFLVGYSNGKIDIVTKTEIITITDLYRKTIAGNKSLNNIYMLDKYAYIATGFGIVKFDMIRKEFADTYLIDTNGDFIFVNDITISHDTIYAATERGIRKAYKNDPQLTFYKSWKTDVSIQYPNAAYDIIESYNNTIYTNLASTAKLADTLYQKQNNSDWTQVVETQGTDIESIEAHENFILISHLGFVSQYDTTWNEKRKIYNYGEGKFVSCLDATLGKDSIIWLGDNSYGLVKSPREFVYEIINPKSPKSASVEGMDIVNNKIWIAAGGRENNWNNNYSNEGVFWRDENLDWGDINKFQDTALNGVFDFLDVKVNPFNNDLAYGASLGGGLIAFEGHKTKMVYNNTNSDLKEAVDIKNWVGITGLDFDDQGNLWMTNSRNTNSIAVLSADKKIYSYGFGSLTTNDLTGPILVGVNNYKWALLPNSGKGILVFDDNGTLDDITDDQSRILGAATGTGGLPNKDVYSIAMDNDGKIWVGTSEGVAVFYSPGNVFDEGANVDAQQIIVSVDGYFQYLLGTETVTAIAVDGANRKWFGTRSSGVFLMSADGTKELHHFTAENSPLLSNYIRAIAINQTTGEVVFGTNEGMIAFKGTATGTEVTTASTYAYPNPVPESYFGLIAIKGLSANSEVRITDIAGNLVFSTVAEGTQAVWNGNDMNGQRVATGVYLVFGIDTEGKDSQVSKIMFTK